MARTRWVVKKNRLASIVEEIPRVMRREVDAAADHLTMELKSTLWLHTGMVRDVTTERNSSGMHAEVWIGYKKGHGFYSRFQEWGTVKQGARPMVGPAAERLFPQWVLEVGQAIAQAAEA